MNTKRKISGRKILQLALTVVVTTACVLAISASSNIQEHKKLKGVKINITNDRYRFIDQQQVKDLLLNDRHININELSVGKIDLNRMERIIASNPWVESAQVYLDNKKIMHVNVSQRVPVARLFEQTGGSYYLDQTLKTMPLSDKYSHYSTVVTNVPELKEDSTSKSLKAQIVKLVKFIDADTFWRAQVSQVILNDDKTFEIVPVLGNQRILIGDTSRITEKFNNLFTFYKKVSNRIGWDKYEVLDVRFAGQVVASPALAWKKPVDNSMSNMSWVKTIIGEDKVAESDTPATRMVNTITIATPGITNIKPAEVKKEEPPKLVPQAKAAPQAKPKLQAKKVEKKKTNNNKEKPKQPKSTR